MQLRHLRWARSAQLLNAVRSTSGITRTAAARSLRMGSGTATGLIERMRGGHLPRRYQAAGDRLPRSAHTQKGPWFLRSRSHAVSGGWPWQVWMAHLRWLRRPDRGSAWLGPGADRGRIRSCGGRPVEVDPPVRGPGQDRQASVALVRRGCQCRVKAHKQDHAGARKPQQFGHPWFPNKALGAGCAGWACETSITFARTWHQRMGLTHDFDELYLTSLPVDIDDGWRVPHRGGSQQPGCLTPRGGRRRRG